MTQAHISAPHFDRCLPPTLPRLGIEDPIPRHGSPARIIDIVRLCPATVDLVVPQTSGA